MKTPKTKFEREVVASLSSQVKPLTKNLERKAYRQVCWHIARRYANGRTRCLVCGNDFNLAKPCKKATCPHCRTKVEVTDSKRQIYDSMEYYTRFESFGEDTQIVRMYQIHMRQRTSEKPSFLASEVLRFWFSPKGFAVEGKPLKPFQCYYDVFRHEAPVQLRSFTQNISYIVAKDSQCLDDADICKAIKMRLPEDLLQKTWRWYQLFHDVYIPEVETLLKTGERGMAVYDKLDLKFIHENWPSIKIALRHGFEFLDPTLWADTINLMKQFKMDVRNPQLIATNRYREIHDTLHRRIERAKEKERRQAEIRQKKRELALEKEWEEKYILMKKKYFDLSFVDVENNIKIEPLKSVDEFKRQGEDQHICVATAHYYRRENSLILSATKNKHILATIEVNLKDYTILQCRGKHNQVPRFHKEIMNLVLQNMDKIHACA